MSQDVVDKISKDYRDRLHKQNKLTIILTQKEIGEIIAKTCGIDNHVITDVRQNFKTFELELKPIY